MSRTLPLLIACTVVLAACATPDADAPGESESPTAETASAVPNPENPAGYPDGELPPGWTWRFDRGSDYTVGNDQDSSDVWFVTMTPGWHVTTGPAGIFYHPEGTASGQYTASTKIHLFDPGERNESFGIFVGGSNLQDEDQAYLYFLVRRSGEYLVKRRTGSETSDVIGWTAHPAVVGWTEDVESTATNTLAVHVRADAIAFAVNETEVAAVPRGDLPTDGIVGLRVNHGLNLHVSGFSVEPAG